MATPKKKIKKKTKQYKKLTIPEVRKVLKKGLSINEMARQTNVSWHTMRSFINKYPKLKEIHDKNRELIIPIAKDYIKDAILDGDLGICKWYLQVMDPEYQDKLKLDGDVDINIIIKGMAQDKLDKLEDLDLTG